MKELFKVILVRLRKKKAVEMTPNTFKNNYIQNAGRTGTTSNSRDFGNHEVTLVCLFEQWIKGIPLQIGKTWCIGDEIE